MTRRATLTRRRQRRRQACLRVLFTLRQWQGAAACSGIESRYVRWRQGASTALRRVRGWVRRRGRRVGARDVGEKAWQVVLISVVLVLLWMAFILHFIARA